MAPDIEKEPLGRAVGTGEATRRVRGVEHKTVPSELMESSRSSETGLS